MKPHCAPRVSARGALPDRATSSWASVADAASMFDGQLVDVNSQLPQAAHPALIQMLDTPGGPRALASAARSILLNNPILQHQGAPCHTLLVQLASSWGELKPALLPLPTPPRPTHNPDDYQWVRKPTGIKCDTENPLHGNVHSRVCSRHSCSNLDWPNRVLRQEELRPPSASAILAIGHPMRQDLSSEAVEVLSSQFFTGRCPVGYPSLATHADAQPGQFVPKTCCNRR